MKVSPEMVSHDAMWRLSRRISAEMGLDYPPERWRDLRRGLLSSLPELGLGSEAETVSALAASPLTQAQVDILASHLTVGETYFWREPNTLVALHERVLPPLLHERRQQGTRRLRVWSVACSSGEEPYSIAILLDRLLPDVGEWDILIRATDINRNVLRKAAAGVYGQWSFRGTPTIIKERYFRQSGNFFEISPDIRKRVNFSYFNLAQDLTSATETDAQNFDIILCRNVLIYFGAEKTREIIDGLTRCLQPGGWFVVSPVETSLVAPGALKPVNFHEATLFRKEISVVRPLFGQNVAGPGGAAGGTAGGPAAEQDGADGAGPVTGSSGGHALAAGGMKPRPAPRSGQSAPNARSGRALPPARGATQGTPSPGVRGTQITRRTPSAGGLGATGRETDASRSRGENARAVSPALQDAGGKSAAREMYGQAQAAAGAGRLNEALEWCDRALEGDRLNPLAHYLRATILQEKGETGTALQSLQRAVYLDSSFVMAHFSLGNLLDRQGRTGEARQHFEHALRLLKSYPPGSMVPESEGLPAGQLSEIIVSMTSK